MKSSTVRRIVVAAACLGVSIAKADWELPSIVGDNMVLQRGTEAAIWGWDAPGGKVAVTFRERTVEATAGADGKWTARVPTGAAGGPFVLTIRGSREVALKNVMVGEVWIAGGQSNMWWPLKSCRDAAKEIAAADFPDIRMWDANTGAASAGWKAATPQRTVKTEWKVTTPAAATNYPGVPYFFARDLYQKLGVPIGIVHLAVPGSPIELFASRALCEACPLGGSDRPPKKDLAPDAAAFLNGMVIPAAPFTAKGIVWWQGESNADRPTQYKALFAGLIKEWRAEFEMDDAPFIFVELHNFGNRVDGVQDAPWPALRDAQRATLTVPNTHMVSVLDIKDDPPVEADWTIHPAHKQIAGERLFHAAMATAYGDAADVGYGPQFKRATFKDAEAVVAFDDVGGGLQARGGGELKGFALAGADRHFVNAAAAVRDGTVVVTAKDVPQPVAVRYDWANNPVGNLVNREGLPACAFRSDDWELKMDK